MSIIYNTHPLLCRYNLSYTLSLLFVIKTLPPLPSEPPWPLELRSDEEVFYTEGEA